MNGDKGRIIHVLESLPPERFQGPLRSLWPLAPDLTPPLTLEDCPRDPVTGALIMSKPEPIDHSLTTSLGPPLRNEVAKTTGAPSAQNADETVDQKRW